MQNIDLVYLLSPVIVIAFSFGLVVYWQRTRSLTKWVILYSFLAYFGAIILKYIVQIPTLHSFEIVVGGNLEALGAYYGIQTVVFEVGGAFVVASFAVKHGHLDRKDAPGFGLSLAFWENGVYLGILALINLVTYYVILSGNSALSQLLYGTLSKTTPGLFQPPYVAIRDVGLSIIERVSSLLMHFSWGYLVVLAAVHRKKLLLALALPMGLVDFFVPFANSIGLTLFEFLFLALALFFFFITLTVVKRVRHNAKVDADISRDSSHMPDHKLSDTGDHAILKSQGTQRNKQRTVGCLRDY